MSLTKNDKNMGGTPRKMRGLTRALRRFFLFMAVAALVVELGSFLAILAMNYMIYGSVREGTRIIYDSYTLYTSASGLRDTIPGRTSESAHLNRLIWFFGGSTMRCDEAETEETIPSIISRELNTHGPYNYTCVNFGVNSFNSMQELQHLQKALLENPIWPDLVVFLDGANDASYCILSREKEAHEGYDKIKGFVESYWRSPLGLFKSLTAAVYASHAWELYARLAYGLTTIPGDSPLLPAIWQAVLARYEYVNRASCGMGAKFLAFLQPVAWQEPPRADMPEQELKKRITSLPAMAANFTHVYDQICTALAGRPYFVSLRYLFVGRDYAAYQSDGIHNTSQARLMLAKAMLPALMAALDSKGQAAEGCVTLPISVPVHGR